jgi:ubiquitin carboxyl-terminal hydrolase L3
MRKMRLTSTTCASLGQVNEGHLYVLDGDRKNPLDTVVALGQDEDVLSEKSLTIVRDFIKQGNEGDVNFSLMALVAEQ